MARRGFPEAADRIQELWLAGRKAEAVAAVPADYIESGALLGSSDRIRRRWPASIHDGLTGLIIRAHQDEALTLAADLAGTTTQESP